MRWLLLATTLFVSTPANAQTTPYKLVILWGNSGISVVDYPSAARCDAARQALDRRKERERELRKVEKLPGGGMIVPAPWQMEMVCIPG